MTWNSRSYRSNTASDASRPGPLDWPPARLAAHPFGNSRPEVHALRMPLSPNDWLSTRLTYGITPPKASFTEDRRREVAEIQSRRIRTLPIDALVVYDLQDESSRTQAKRPFPFMQAIDPLEYALDYLDVPQRKIVYRSVSGQDEALLSDWLRRLEAQGGAAVLVGAPSSQQAVRLKLRDAYALCAKAAPALPLGGVLIAERHRQRASEDARVLKKMERGCSLFISQAVYSVTQSKDVLSDLHYRCLAEERPMPPILMTLTPCGSRKTLEFLAWLGISVPRWLQNDLAHADDILEASVEASLSAFNELHAFADAKGFALGCNIESVSTRKAEIEASVEMVYRAAEIMGRNS